MYTFIQLCRLKPELYNETMQIESRKKLSHLSNGCKRYTDALERQLAGIKGQDLTKEENKLRSVALRTTKNISAMIVGLFKRPSDFKTSITLSCKPQPIRVETKTASSGGESQNQNNNNNRPNKQFKNSNNNNTSSNNNNSYNRGAGGNQYNRQVGQKSKYRGNYQTDYRGGNKRPRHSR